MKRAYCSIWGWETHELSRYHPPNAIIHKDASYKKCWGKQGAQETGEKKAQNAQDMPLLQETQAEMRPQQAYVPAV